MIRVLEEKDAVHSVPQLIPAGLLLTVQLPVPILLTLSVKGCAAALGLNVAVTATLEFILTVHTPMPVHAPLQLENTEPPPAVAVRATLVPLEKLVEHVLPQLIPAGLLLTVPLPVPFLLTLSVNFCEDPLLGLYAAVTVMSELSVTVHAPVPEQPAPLQPENTKASPSRAARVTLVPPEKLAEHVLPQLMPAGLLVTSGPPPPVLLTVSINVPAVC